MSTPPRVLVVAGSDSGGGAGIQADIKTLSALGVYAATAVTAATVQNTTGVSNVHPIPPEIVADQMRVVLDDIGADCLKFGMLGDAATVDAVADVLDDRAAAIPLVLDPVMIAKGGARLMASDAVARIKTRLLPKATILTPNIPEAEALTGLTIEDTRAMSAAATALRALGPRTIYLKGGHLTGERVVDLFLDESGEETFESQRIDTRHTHGTGCTLASAIAAGLASHMDRRAACQRAHAFVQEALRTAPGLGSGHGPLTHLFTVQPFKY